MDALSTSRARIDVKAAVASLEERIYSHFFLTERVIST